MQAAVRAMRAASSVQEHWLAINSAVLVYNAALSYMQQHRYADLYRWLRPVAEALVALPKADSDGALAVAVAEALGRAAEHRLLLAAARARAARDAGGLRSGGRCQTGRLPDDSDVLKHPQYSCIQQRQGFNLGWPVHINLSLRLDAIPRMQVVRRRRRTSMTTG